MNITFTAKELSEYSDDLANWYNQLTMFVLENYAQNFNSMDERIRGGKELFHMLAKKFQEDHPKPDWRSLL